MWRSVVYREVVGYLSATKNNTSPQVLLQHLAIANQWDGSYTMETLPGKGLNLN